MSNLKIYLVEDGGECVWAITDDPEKARSISREYLRDSDDPDEYDPENITELPMDLRLSLTNEDEEDGEVGERTLTCADGRVWGIRVRPPIAQMGRMRKRCQTTTIGCNKGRSRERWRLQRKVQIRAWTLPRFHRP